MTTLKGPAIFLAQFLNDQVPFNNLDSICEWVFSLGYKGIQIPTWDKRCFNLELASKSKDYCEEISALVQKHGMVITELSTHLQGQLIAVSPAYDELFDSFAPKEFHGNSKGRSEWAKKQLEMAAKASQSLGLSSVATFSGALLWHMVYPWPQRPPGLVDMGFKELAKRWMPILNFYEDHGIDLCYELHPGEDLHDGISFERFLKETGNHPRVNILYDPSHFVLQQLDYLAFIDFYHPKIKMFHVKDAEFNPSGKSGVYGAYQEWIDRPGRFRSLGDGQINFKGIFSKLAQYNYQGWAVLEWECCIKDSMQGALEGSKFIQDCIIQVGKRSFDDFAGTVFNQEFNHNLLGL